MLTVMLEMQADVRRNTQALTRLEIVVRKMERRARGLDDDEDELEETDNDVLAGLVPCTTIQEVRLLEHRLKNEERTMKAAVSKKLLHNNSSIKRFKFN